MNYLVTIILPYNHSKLTIYDYLSGKVDIVVKLPSFSFNLDFLFLFKVGYISKPKPIVSEYLLNKMLLKLELPVYNYEYINCLEDYNFISHCSLNCLPIYHNFFLLLSNRFCNIIFLTVLVYLMRKVSTILCNGYISQSFIAILNMGYKVKENTIIKKKPFVIRHFLFIPYSLFISFNNYTIRISNWVSEYLYKFSYKKLYNDILYTIYSNVKHLITKFYLSFTLSIKKLPSIIYKVFSSFNYNIIAFSNFSLNVIYASLTVVYILLGWLLDYLSFVWLLIGKSMNYRYIFHLSFWMKRSFYAILYILWLYIGVFTTNGVYFLILNNVSSLNSFNIIIILVGSIISYVSSNLWFFYGQGITPRTFNIRDNIIFPLLFNTTYRTPIWALFIQIRNVIFSPVNFNLYSTARRSLLEWLSFIGMVFSTYGTWNLYVANVFPLLSITQNLLIWGASSIISGFALIYLEESRPRIAHIFYGFLYLSFWTSICFFTNSILTGFFDINNSLSALVYFIPLNFFLAFIYSVPLYRGTVRLTMIDRLLHLFLFILLISITLICAGLIWYLIAPT